MLVAEFGVNSPILREALASSTETAVEHEEIYQTEEGIKFIFWAEGEDLEAFEEGLSADPTVQDEVQLAETQSRRLYRVTFTDRGEEVATFPSWSELDISFLHSKGTHDRWEVRMRMPDRDALAGYRDVCEENGLEFELQSVYEETDGSAETDRRTEAELTPMQEEALQKARELGYYEVPREASLADVADELEITPQALSERLRRGTPTLVDALLGAGDG